MVLAASTSEIPNSIPHHSRSPQSQIEAALGFFLVSRDPLPWCPVCHLLLGRRQLIPLFLFPHFSLGHLYASSRVSSTYTEVNRSTRRSPATLRRSLPAHVNPSADDRHTTRWPCLTCRSTILRKTSTPRRDAAELDPSPPTDLDGHDNRLPFQG